MQSSGKFSAFGSTVLRVAKLLKGMAKRQKQDEVWDSLGRTTNLNPMATCLQFCVKDQCLCTNFLAICVSILRGVIAMRPTAGGL